MSKLKGIYPFRKRIHPKNEQLDRIERMLKWIIIECIPVHKRKTVHPDISDIIEKK